MLLIAFCFVYFNCGFELPILVVLFVLQLLLGLGLVGLVVLFGFVGSGCMVVVYGVVLVFSLLLWIFGI